MAESCGACGSTDVSHGAVGLRCLTCGAKQEYSDAPYSAPDMLPKEPAKKAAKTKKG